MEQEGSSPCSQSPIYVLIFSHINPLRPPSQHTAWISILILSSHPRLGLPSGLFPSGLPTKTLYTSLLSRIHAKCPAHLILLDFITQIVFIAVLLARSQYSEGPANGHLDTCFSWFPCVYKQTLRRFPTFQVATTCFSCSPPDLNLAVTNFIFSVNVK